MTNFLEYDIIQKNEFNLKITLKNNNEPIDISDKLLYVILKRFDDNLSDDTQALINREISFTEEQKNNAEFFLNLTSEETDLDVYQYKLEIILKNTLEYETLLQAKINILESYFKNE